MKLNMVKKYVSIIMTTFLLFEAVGITSSVQAQYLHKSETVSKHSLRSIIIQAPMPIEDENLAKKLKNVKEEKSGGFVYWIGTLDDYPIIATKIGKGMENTAAANQEYILEVVK